MTEALRTSLKKPHAAHPKGAACKTCEEADNKKKKKKSDQDKKVDAMTKNLGPKAKADIAKSPTMQRQLAELHDKGVKIHTGEEHFKDYGSGYKGYTDATGQNIYLRDSNDTLSLAHEVQHSYNSMTGEHALQLGQDGLTKDQWTQRYVDTLIEDERSAFGHAGTIRGEILGNGGGDIGTPPAFSNESVYRNNYMQGANSAWDRLYGGN